MNPSARGLENYEKGHAFEGKVADIYKLLRYSTVPDRQFHGRQVDIFLTGRFGDLVVHRAIECKAGAVVASDIDAFLTKLRLVRHDYPDALGTIVSGGSFTAAVKDHASIEGIQLTNVADLEASLFDGHAYVQSLRVRCLEDERYALPHYVEPLVGDDLSGPSEPALSVVKEWIKSRDWNQLTLLGDIGIGKSFLSRVVALDLAEKYQQDSVVNPVPVLIDLRKAEREFSLEGLVLTHFAQTGVEITSFDAFSHYLSAGRAVLILDGFDEMAARVTKQVTLRNFNELARCVKGRSKVMLTCRTHYFRSRTEEEEVIIGSRGTYESETARDLYWDLVSRKGFRIAYLRPFDQNRITQYVELTKGDHARAVLRRMNETYNLMQLSQRPLLLNMIVRSIDRLKEDVVAGSDLYRVFTDAWVHREEWREGLTADAKLTFCTALARALWQEAAPTIHHTDLLGFLRDHFGPDALTQRQLEELEHDARTSSFLTRDRDGNYGFVHKSFSEYFLARHLADELNDGNVSVLATQRLSREVAGFLAELADPTVDTLLTTVVTRKYERKVSENSLVCLYELRARKRIDSSGHVVLPSGAQLDGAQLYQVYLESAVLQRASFSSADLSEASLARCRLTRCQFVQTRFAGCDLNDSDLSESDLTDANCVGATFERANCDGATFHRTNLSSTLFLVTSYAGADFEDANIEDAARPDGLSAYLSSKSLSEPESQVLSDLFDKIVEFRPELVSRLNAYAFADLDAEDLVSDAIVEIIKDRRRLAELEHDDKRLFTLLYQKARSRGMLERQRLGRQVELTADFDERFIEAEQDLVLEEYLIDDVLSAIKDRLDAKMFQIVELIAANGLTTNQAADSAGVSVYQARKAINTARSIAREIIDHGLE